MMQSSQRRHARGDQSHQLFRSSGQFALKIGVVVDVVETLHQKVVRLLDVYIEPRTGLDEAARNLTLLGHLLFGEEVSGFFSLWSRLF